MSARGPIASVGSLRDRMPYVTGRAAALVGVPALGLLFVRTPWAWLAAVLWAGLTIALIAYDVSQAVRPGELEVTRSVPEKLSMGVPNPIDVTLASRSALPARLTCRETPPAGFVGNRGFGPFEIEPRGERVVRLHLTPPGRGAFEFGRLGVRSMGPIGLAGRMGEAGEPLSIRVYPDITAVHKYALLARKGALFELGIRQLRLSGRGTEFESLRDYLPGDTFRDVDWKATARKGRPVVRTYEVERSQTMVLAIDAGRMMTPVVEGMSKLDRAVNAALLLAYLGLEAEDHVGLLVFGRDVQAFLPPRKGRRQFGAILEALYSVEGRVEEPDYPRALRYLASKLGKRSLVTLFTDLSGTDTSRRLLATLDTLTPRHLPLVITQRNRFLEQVASDPPAEETDGFRAAVSEGVLRDKDAALRTLQAAGSLALDVFPEELSVAAVNRYLTIKARGEL